MAIVLVNPAGNTPRGLEAKGGEERTIAVVPASDGEVDGRDFLIWQRNLGTAVSEAASESHFAGGPAGAAVDVLGSSPAPDWLLA